MRVNLIYFVFVIICVLNSCRQANQEQKDIQEHGNIYSDATLQKIYQYRCLKNLSELVKFSNSEFVEYRKATALAFASLRSELSILPVASMLSDSDDGVRMAAAFALGQIGSQNGVQPLLEALKKENNDNVKAIIFESLGKCGGEEEFDFVCSQEFNAEDFLVWEGVIRCLCRFQERDFYGAKSIDKIFKVLNDTLIDERVRCVAAEYVSNCKLDLSKYTESIIKFFNCAKLVATRTNLVASIGKCKNQEALEFLHSLLVSDFDYRITIKAIEACGGFKYSESRDLMLNLLKSSDERISAAASGFILLKGVAADSLRYLDLSHDVQSWQARVRLIAAALKYSKDKKAIANQIKSGFDVTENIYEKGALLRALACDPESYKFIEKQTFYSKTEYLRTEGLKTLIQMSNSSDFKEYAKKVKRENDINLDEEFSLIFKTAVQNGNPTMVALAAKTIAENNEYTYYYNNTYFLKQALDNCVMPRDEDTYRILADAIYKVNGQIVADPQASADIFPDWQNVSSIADNQKVKFYTQRGEFVLQLKVNEAPFAVSNFVELIKVGYYNETVFDDVMPGILVENHGNMSGFEETRKFFLPSEYSLDPICEGSVVMASSPLGNASSVEWIIMRVPLVAFDGNYTNIATIVEGMDVVHNLQTGDMVLKAELIP